MKINKRLITLFLFITIIISGYFLHQCCWWPIKETAKLEQFSSCILNPDQSVTLIKENIHYFDLYNPQGKLLNTITVHPGETFHIAHEYTFYEYKYNGIKKNKKIFDLTLIEGSEFSIKDKRTRTRLIVK